MPPTTAQTIEGSFAADLEPLVLTLGNRLDVPHTIQVLSGICNVLGCLEDPPRTKPAARNALISLVTPVAVQNVVESFAQLMGVERILPVRFFHQLCCTPKGEPNSCQMSFAGGVFEMLEHTISQLFYQWHLTIPDKPRAVLVLELLQITEAICSDPMVGDVALGSLVQLVKGELPNMILLLVLVRQDEVVPAGLQSKITECCLRLLAMMVDNPNTRFSALTHGLKEEDFGVNMTPAGVVEALAALCGLAEPDPTKLPPLSNPLLFTLISFLAGLPECKIPMEPVREVLLPAMLDYIQSEETLAYPACFAKILDLTNSCLISPREVKHFARSEGEQRLVEGCYTVATALMGEEESDVSVVAECFRYAFSILYKILKLASIQYPWGIGSRVLGVGHPATPLHKMRGELIEPVPLIGLIPFVVSVEKKALWAFRPPQEKMGEEGVQPLLLHAAVVFSGGLEHTCLLQKAIESTELTESLASLLKYCTDWVGEESDSPLEWRLTLMHSVSNICRLVATELRARHAKSLPLFPATYLEPVLCSLLTLVPFDDSEDTQSLIHTILQALLLISPIPRHTMLVLAHLPLKHINTTPLNKNEQVAELNEALCAALEHPVAVAAEGMQDYLPPGKIKEILAITYPDWRSLASRLDKLIEAMEADPQHAKQFALSGIASTQRRQEMWVEESLAELGAAAPAVIGAVICSVQAYFEYDFIELQRREKLKRSRLEVEEQSLRGKLSNQASSSLLHVALIEELHMEEVEGRKAVTVVEAQLFQQISDAHPRRVLEIREASARAAIDLEVQTTRTELLESLGRAMLTRLDEKKFKELKEAERDGMAAILERIQQAKEAVKLSFEVNDEIEGTLRSSIWANEQSKWEWLMQQEGVEKEESRRIEGLPLEDRETVRRKRLEVVEKSRLLRVTATFIHSIAVVDMQRVARGHLGRKAAKRYRKEDAAARTVQRVWQGYLGRVIVKRWKAARTIQMAWRSYQSRITGYKLFQDQLEHKSALRITGFFRCIMAAAEKARLTEQRLEDFAARIITNFFRMVQARHIAWIRLTKGTHFAHMTEEQTGQLYNPFLRETRIIQGLARLYIARRRARVERETLKEQLAPTHIQRLWRGWLARRRVHRLLARKQKIHKGIILIQKIWRGALCRKSWRPRIRSLLDSQALFLSESSLHQKMMARHRELCDAVSEGKDSSALSIMSDYRASKTVYPRTKNRPTAEVPSYLAPTGRIRHYPEQAGKARLAPMSSVKAPDLGYSEPRSLNFAVPETSTTSSCNLTKLKAHQTASALGVDIKNIPYSGIHKEGTVGRRTHRKPSAVPPNQEFKDAQRRIMTRLLEKGPPRDDWQSPTVKPGGLLNSFPPSSPNPADIYRSAKKKPPAKLRAIPPKAMGTESATISSATDQQVLVKASDEAVIHRIMTV